jgi:hypothetical protein
MATDTKQSNTVLPDLSALSSQLAQSAMTPQQQAQSINQQALSSLATPVKPYGYGDYYSQMQNALSDTKLNPKTGKPLTDEEGNPVSKGFGDKASGALQALTSLANSPTGLSMLGSFAHVDPGAQNIFNTKATALNQAYQEKENARQSSVLDAFKEAQKQDQENRMKIAELASQQKIEGMKEAGENTRKRAELYAPSALTETAQKYNLDPEQMAKYVNAQQSGQAPLIKKRFDFGPLHWGSEVISPKTQQVKGNTSTWGKK